MTNVHHPTAVNQFYRLDRDTPTSPLVKVARWNHIHADAAGRTTNWDGVLCMATGGAIALDAHTGGVHRTTPGRIHDFQDDRSGGIGVDDVDTAWHRGWGKDLLTPDFYDWNDVIYAVRVQRRHAIIAVDYGLVPYEYQVQKGGTFDHYIGLDDFRSSDSRIYRYDSLDTKPVWTPQSAYRAAAEAIALRVRGSRGRLFVGLTQSRPLLATVPLYRVAITGGLNHSTPLKDKPYGKTVAHVSTATYVCTRHKVEGQWWYQILPNAKTDNRGLWISPTRYTEVDPL